MKTLILSLLSLYLISLPAQAEEALSVTAQQAYSMVQEEGSELLFIDVRDPVEIMFIGFTDAVDRNIPFKLADRSRFLEDKGRFAMDITRILWRMSKPLWRKRV